MALHALRREIGNEAFNRILREWPAKHRDGNASWPEFEQFAQNIAGKDLGGFYAAWFHSDSQPDRRPGVGGGPGPRRPRWHQPGPPGGDQAGPAAGYYPVPAGANGRPALLEQEPAP